MSHIISDDVLDWHSYNPLLYILTYVLRKRYIPKILMSYNTDVSTMISTPLTIRANNTSQKYHAIDCCESTRGIDTLLSRYNEDRKDVTLLVSNNPDDLIQSIWKQDGPLAIDYDCRCQMGKQVRTPFTCAQCRNMRRLIDFRHGGVDRPFQIECGSHVGNKLVVSAYHVSSPFLMWDDVSTQRARQYIQQYRSLTACGTPNMRNITCITGDSFTIRTLIMWMISELFANKGLPHIPTLHTAFICSGKGYSLYDMPNIGTMNDLHKIPEYHRCNVLKADIAKAIIIQLLVILLELSTINFSHGTPSLHGLIFTRNPVSYMYDGVHVSAPLTVQISNLWNSSATFGSNHFFPRDVKSSVFIERNMFVPEIAIKRLAPAHCTATQSSTSICQPQETVLYRLTSNTLDIYTAMRHIGFPLYVGSFDFYCFMVSLMCDKAFYEAVVNDDSLYRLWSMMWTADDLLLIEDYIKDTHADKLPEEPWQSPIRDDRAVDIIRGAWLRCDIVPYMWNLIKQGW